MLVVAISLASHTVSKLGGAGAHNGFAKAIEINVGTAGLNQTGAQQVCFLFFFGRGAFRALGGTGQEITIAIQGAIQNFLARAAALAFAPVATLIIGAQAAHAAAAIIAALQAGAGRHTNVHAQTTGAFLGGATRTAGAATSVGPAGLGATVRFTRNVTETTLALHPLFTEAANTTAAVIATLLVHTRRDAAHNAFPALAEVTCRAGTA